MIKCKSNKCLLLHVCSPKLITFCLFMRLPGGQGLPRAGCRAAGLRRPGLGRGLFGDKGSPGGHNPPGPAQKSSPGPWGCPALRDPRGTTQVQRGCGWPAPHPQGWTRTPRAGSVPPGSDPYPQGQICTPRVGSVPPRLDPHPQGRPRTPAPGPAPRSASAAARKASAPFSPCF